MVSAAFRVRPDRIPSQPAPEPSPGGAGPSPASLEPEEPMHRYVYPTARPAARQGGREGAPAEVQAALERILEQMACQNQLLIDLLGAVNSLTAALLSVHSRA